MSLLCFWNYNNLLQTKNLSSHWKGSIYKHLLPLPVWCFFDADCFIMKQNAYVSLIYQPQWIIVYSIMKIKSPVWWTHDLRTLKVCWKTHPQILHRLGLWTQTFLETFLDIRQKLLRMVAIVLWTEFVKHCWSVEYQSIFTILCSKNYW